MRKVVCSVLAIAVIGMMGLAHSVSANPWGGSLTGISRVPARGVNLHLVTYKGGERADFAVTGDGCTTLNVVVKDQNGNVVVRTQGPGDRCHVYWQPAFTAVYSVFVINEGGVFNDYAWRAF